ncbi:MAG: RDD family protein [Polyangiales bacterium]
MTRPLRARVSGYYAGPVSRLLAYVIDMFVASTGFGLIAALVVGSINTVFRIELEWDWQAGVLGLLAFSVWLFLYLSIGISITGRTLGTSVLGIKVVSREGRPVSPGRAAVRVLVLPVSITTVVGVLGIILDRKQRALHDLVAKTAVVYDWGDRPAELPAPLSKWLAEHGVDDGSTSRTVP